MVEKNLDTMWEPKKQSWLFILPVRGYETQK